MRQRGIGPEGRQWERCSRGCQSQVSSTTDLLFWSSHFGEKSAPESEKCFLTEDPSKLAGPHKKLGFAKSALSKKKPFKKRILTSCHLYHPGFAKSFHLLKPQKCEITKREPISLRLKTHFVRSFLFVCFTSLFSNSNNCTLYLFPDGSILHRTKCFKIIWFISIQSVACMTAM